MQTRLQKADPLLRLAGYETNLFFVGDLHGEYGQLMQKLDAAGFDFTRDQLICVGDLIDRGPESDRCLHLLDEPWFHAVLGNHELMMIDAVTSPDDAIMFRNWIRNGGYWVIEDDLDLDGMNERALKAARMMPQAIEVNVCTSRGTNVKVGVIHADVASGQWRAFDRERDAWSRDRFKKASQYLGPVEGIDLVVVGHSIVAKPTWHENVLNIDTGAFTEQGELTLLRADELLKVDDFASPAQAVRDGCSGDNEARGTRGRKI